MNGSRKLLVATIAGAAVLGFGLTLPSLGVKGVHAAPTVNVNGTAKLPRAAEDLSVAFANVADVIKPSVVNVSSVKAIKPSQHMQRWRKDPQHGQAPGSSGFDRARDHGSSRGVPKRSEQIPQGQDR